MAEIIEMPKLSDTMSTGTLVKWLKQEGDPVTAGDMLCEVETDKATMEVENFAEGVILKQYVAEGGQIPVGSPMCAIGKKGEAVPEVEAAPAKDDKPSKESQSDKPKSKGKASEAKREAQAAEDAAAAEDKSATASAESDSDDDSSDSSGRLKASPLARKLAREKKINLTSIKGTGPGGRILRDDVLGYEKSGSKETTGSDKKPSAPATPAFTGEDKKIPVSNMRGAIARRLVESKTTIPHFYLETEIDAAPLLQLRQSVNQHLGELPPEQGGIKLTVNDYILKATAEALRRVPAVNASWMNDHILQHGSVHLAFGVAIDDGLITPVIRDAQNKSLRHIGSEAKALIAKARARKLKPEEFTGSTFTVTNLGMFGINRFYGIVNPPNAGILSVGATVTKAVVDAKGQIVPGQRMSIGFSGDHRVVDGAAGAQFLQALKAILETPALMLV